MLKGKKKLQSSVSVSLFYKVIFLVNTLFMEGQKSISRSVKN